MAQVTTEDIKKIVSGFFLNAPPGEFHEVVTDVRGLLKNDALLNEIAAETFKEYNTQQMLLVNSPDHDHKVLITKYGEVGPNEYLDPQGGQVVNFDHFLQEVNGSRKLEGGELDSEAEPWRSAVQAKVQDYVHNFYDHGAAAVYATISGSVTTVTVCISSAIFNGTNFYNGRWRSVWSVKIAGGKAELEGNIRINVHYYEDGNVQLNTNTNKKQSGFAAKDPKSLADQVVKTISDLEGEFQNNLEVNYEKMNSTTFKALRRVLPVFATKIKWEKISHYVLGSDIKKT